MAGNVRLSMFYTVAMLSAVCADNLNFQKARRRSLSY